MGLFFYRPVNNKSLTSAIYLHKALLVDKQFDGEFSDKYLFATQRERITFEPIRPLPALHQGNPRPSGFFSDLFQPGHC